MPSDQNKNLIHSILPKSNYRRFVLFSSLLYMGAVTVYMIWHQQFFSPDRFFVFAFLGMTVVGRGLEFLWDWLPPVLLILGYEYLRGIVPLLITKVHIHAMIYFDTAIFGTVPTLWLQQHFFASGSLHWYDFTAVTLYLLHFVVPLMVALFFWITDRSLFQKYMIAMVILSYLAFITYLLFPAMPPWMASQQGFLPNVAHIMDQVLQHFARPISLPTAYQYVGANLVAAVPSLHAAYPFMTALFLFHKFRRYGWLSFVYPAAMWISVLYLGEHYTFDITVAILYTLAIYAAVIDYKGIRTKITAMTLNLLRKRKILAVE